MFFSSGGELPLYHALLKSYLICSLTSLSVPLVLTTPEDEATFGCCFYMLIYHALQHHRKYFLNVC